MTLSWLLVAVLPPAHLIKLWVLEYLQRWLEAKETELERLALGDYYDEYVKNREEGRGR